MLLRSLFILILIILLIALASYFVASKLSAPHQVETNTDFIEDFVYEDIVFQTSRGNSIRGWFVPHHSAKGAVLLLHGVRANRMMMQHRMAFLHKAGYAVLLIDFQAHGESQGAFISFGHLESEDAYLAFKYLKQRVPQQKIGVIGVSLGGASAVFSPLKYEADAMVLEAVYSSLEVAVQNRIALRLGEWSRVLSPLLSLQSPYRFGFDVKSLSPLYALSQTKVPTFIIAGSKDEHTTINESKAMYQAIKSPKEFWELTEASHQNFHRLETEVYEKKILNFFDKWL